MSKVNLREVTERSQYYKRSGKFCGDFCQLWTRKSDSTYELYMHRHISRENCGEFLSNSLSQIAEKNCEARFCCEVGYGSKWRTKVYRNSRKKFPRSLPIHVLILESFWRPGLMETRKYFPDIWQYNTDFARGLFQCLLWTPNLIYSTSQGRDSVQGYSDARPS